MEVILDTNALSALLDGDPAIRGVLEQAGMIYLSPVVLGKYRFGILASRYRSQYEQELARMEMEVPALPLDEVTASHYAEIRQELKSAGSPIPWHDPGSLPSAASTCCRSFPVMHTSIRSRASPASGGKQSALKKPFGEQGSW